jgi:tyrosyl-tRNA synthetase
VATGLAASNSEARKLIANNGLKLNDVAVSDPKLLVGRDDLTADGVLKLSSGKKKHVLVKPA